MKKLSFLLVPLAISAIATARPVEEPYAVAATVTPDRGDYVVVQVTITEKSTGKVVFHPRAVQTATSMSSILSDPIEGQPQFEVRIMTSQGKAYVDFRAFERILQSSHVTAKL